MSDREERVYWIFVVARSRETSRGAASPLRELDVLATGTDTATAADGFCSFRRIVSLNCCFCWSGVKVDQRGTRQIYPSFIWRVSHEDLVARRQTAPASGRGVRPAPPLVASGSPGGSLGTSTMHVDVLPRHRD
jgi:hypothetical protein